MIGIYQIRHLATGRIYVGKTKSHKARWGCHRSLLNQDRHHSPKLQADWNLFGQEAFLFEMLIECELEDLGAYESIFIQHYKPYYNVANPKTYIDWAFRRHESWSDKQFYKHHVLLGDDIINRMIDNTETYDPALDLLWEEWTIFYSTLSASEKELTEHWSAGSSYKALSKKLGIPATTIQCRCERLADRFTTFQQAKIWDSYKQTLSPKDQAFAAYWTPGNTVKTLAAELNMPIRTVRWNLKRIETAFQNWLNILRETKAQTPTK